MKKFIGIGIVFAMVVLASCKKDDYKNDGGISNAYVDMTTYDYLVSNPKFDSLVKVIDKAGLKDAINGDITLFATTNYGIADYVAAKKGERALDPSNPKYPSENFDFGIKDIPAQELSDSLKTYMFAGKINRDQITVTGKQYNSLLGPWTDQNDFPISYIIKFRRAFDYSNYINYVDYVNYVKVIGGVDEDELDPESVPDNQKDRTVEVQTSGIITKTGIIHVLSGGHRLFFNAMPLGN